MVGIGYDIHRITDGEYIVLGGINIPCNFKIIAHSDGDVLIHAIIDALLGAASLGDIGDHFPDTDMKYKNISSSYLLSKTKKLLDEKNLKIVNIDSTIILEAPKLKNYKTEIKQNIASILELDLEQISVKATTNEKLGHIGNSESIASIAVCQIEKLN